MSSKLGNLDPDGERRQSNSEAETLAGRSDSRAGDGNATQLPAPISDTKHIDPFQTVLPTTLVTGVDTNANLGLGLIGDYELLDELGRGGMGIVYLARQRSIDRIVALKVIRRDQLESLHPESQRSVVDRFHQESMAAAKLEHNNIIRLYEVGEHEGQQFFSMQYVPGQSLSDLLREGPLESHRAAGYMASVASAVVAAHEAGILHRDLKPQNVMLDENTDQVLVADFGLAKLMEGEEQLTIAGEVMGTPSYMPPEQAKDASRVTAQSDVYSLGATLYHLLTAKPPFQAATVVETIRQVIDEPPVAPTQLNPAIDRDIETICMKCLEKEPGRRYFTAQELADDLSRYVRGEPIAARPLSVVGRTVRWCRRKPVMAGWIGTAATCLLAAFVSTTVGLYTTSRALAKSEAHYRQSRSTVDFFFTRVSETGLLDQPGMQALREDLLSRALAHYREFVESRSDDPALENELGQANFRLAKITERIRSHAEAIALYRLSLEIQQRLMRENPDNESFRLDAAETWNAMGGAFYELQRLDEAELAFRNARSLREQLAAANEVDAERTRLLANTLMNLGLVEQKRGNYTEANTIIGEAQRRRSQLLDRDAENIRVRRDRAMGYYNLGAGVIAIEKPTRDVSAGGVRALENAVDDLEVILRKQPGSLDDQSRLVTCRRVLGHILGDDKFNILDGDEALDSYSKARDGMQRLAEQNPLVLTYQQRLAGILVNLGDLQLSRQEFDAASSSLQSAILTLQPLADKAPDFRRDLGASYRALALAMASQQQFDLAVSNLKLSVLNFELLSNEWPDNEDYRASLEISEALLRDVEAILNSNT
ncbi:MAG: protein kinase [Planctomycetes bacterium]|nr:protein kinase [Planctomycetota bacterium]